MPANETGSGMSSAGSATMNKYVTIGPIKQTPAYGWGVDTWGSEKWGEEASTTNVELDAGSWSLDNFGQLLVATVRNGKTFSWSPTAASALDTRATAVSGSS